MTNTNKKESLEQGKNIKTITIAKNLLNILDTKTISLKTGLKEEEIKSLKDNN